MGRLTLNVLLSFAQFEREVTSERIRRPLERRSAGRLRRRDGRHRPGRSRGRNGAGRGGPGAGAADGLQRPGRGRAPDRRPYASLGAPVGQTLAITAPIVERSGGQYRYRVTLQLPPIAGGLASLTRLRVELAAATGPAAAPAATSPPTAPTRSSRPAAASSSPTARSSKAASKSSAAPNSAAPPRPTPTPRPSYNRRPRAVSSVGRAGDS